MKRIFLSSLAAVAAVSFAAPAAAGPNNAGKLAYIDVQRALNEVDEAREAFDTLKADFDKKQRLLDAKTEEIKRRQEESESAVVKPEARAQIRKDMEKQFTDLRDLYVKLQSDISEREAAFKNQILQKMKVIIDQLRTEGGYALVVDGRTVLSGPKTDDLTNELINRYNKLYPSVPPAKKGK